jgi:hypothetical protein
MFVTHDFGTYTARATRTMPAPPQGYPGARAFLRITGKLPLVSGWRPVKSSQEAR